MRLKVTWAATKVFIAKTCLLVMWNIKCSLYNHDYPWNTKFGTKNVLTLKPKQVKENFFTANLLVRTPKYRQNCMTQLIRQS